MSNNIRNLNQPPNPIAEFLSSLQDMTSNHPFFAAYNAESRQASGETSAPPYPPESAEDPTSTPSPPRSAAENDHPAPSNGEDPFDRGFPFRSRHHGPHGHPRHHHHGGPPPCGGRGGRGGFARGPRCGGGPRHGPGAAAGFGGPWGSQNMDFGRLAEIFGSYLGNLNPDSQNTAAGNGSDDGAQTDFTPPADVFDTEDAYYIHVPLPGAKKPDLGVSWDADDSTLKIAGVVHRPGDEEFLKSMAMGERKDVGVFERKVRLGTRNEPAAVDADGVTAKMEDGVLVVRVPKLDRDFVEVRKVDVE